MRNTKKIEADVVVVGTGPGGATVARDLTLQGKSVIMIERGANLKPTGSPTMAAKYTGSPGATVLAQPEKIPMTRCITVGGSSAMFTATAFDPDIEKFKKYGVDISPEMLNDIKTELKIAPLPDEYIGSAAKTLFKSAQDLGFEFKKLNKFIDPLKAKGGVITSKSILFGSDVGQPKWQARHWVLDAVNKGATLLTNTYVEEVIVDNKIAVGVYAKGKNKEELEVNANVVVIAAGGVGSPVILQKSGIYEAGQKFFFDPLCLTYGYLDQPTDFIWEPQMIYGMHTDDGVMVTDMGLTWALYLAFITRSKKYSRLLKAKRGLALMTKISDDLDGSVGIDERITKRLSSDDHYKIEKGRSISRKILRNLGAKDIWYGEKSAAHPGGSCRIGTIVDSNLEAEYKNLYVADASVIPEQWGLPPVLTVICLGRRLSKHLSEKV